MLRSLTITDAISIPESDQNLKWDLDIRNIVDKSRIQIDKFKHMKNYVYVKQLVTLCYALAKPHITYGLLI